MAVNLSKGENVVLTKQSPGLTSVLVGLGWDPPSTDQEWDLDASVFLLGSAGKVISDRHFIFYNNLNSPDGAISHTGDNRTGDGDGDDEAIVIDLGSVESAVERIVFAVTIHEAQAKGQNFGQVENSFIRIVERRAGDPATEATGAEIVRYDLGEDFSTETALIFGELRRDSGTWKFEAVGQSPAGDLAGLCRLYGISV